MTKQHYSIFHSLMQRTAASRPGAWLLSRTLHHLDRAVLKLTGARATLTGILSGTPVVILTTHGAKSNLPRTLPLLFIRDDGDPKTFAVVATNWGQPHLPGWYFNLKAHPRATGSIRGQVAEYVAHEASGEEYEKYWQRAVDTYFGFRLYQQRAARRRIPIIVLTRDDG